VFFQKELSGLADILIHGGALLIVLIYPIIASTAHGIALKAITAILYIPMKE